MQINSDLRQNPKKMHFRPSFVSQKRAFPKILGIMVQTVFYIDTMQLVIDIPRSKVSLAQDVLKSLSFVKAVKPLPARKIKTKAVNLNLSKQTEELYGIFEGINAPDKKDIRRAMYESNN